jgi:hypothetical protein
MAKWVLACKEFNAPAWSSTKTYSPGDIISFNGVLYQSVDTNLNQRPPNSHWTTLQGAGVYLTRLPKTIDAHTPGVPSVYFFVGPGARPSVQEYNANLFILSFDYLSHLFCRVVDVNTWPPTEVQPIQISGGPNPPTPFNYNIQLSQDSLTLKTEGQNTSGPGAAVFFNPPPLQQPLLFLDPITMTYSVTLTPTTNFAPQVPANVTPFFRLYRRTFTPTIGPWVLVDDWTPGPTAPWFSFVDTNVGSLQFQYSATWGSQFNSNAPFDPTQHMEGIPGELFITVDSSVQHPSFQFILTESLVLKRSSLMVAANFGQEEMFINEAPDDHFTLSRSLLGQGGNAFFFAGASQMFLNESASDTLAGPFSASNFSAGGNALAASMG